jgi:hypothetical protein
MKHALVEDGWHSRDCGRNGTTFLMLFGAHMKMLYIIKENDFLFVK